jgi:hypothetical protein
MSWQVWCLDLAGSPSALPGNAGLHGMPGASGGSLSNPNWKSAGHNEEDSNHYRLDRSTLQRAGSKSGNDLALEYGEEDKHWNCTHARASH